MFGTKRFVLAAALAAILGLSACGTGRTDTVTNITQTTATLNAKVSCKDGDHGTMYWGWRKVGSGGGLYGNWTTTNSIPWTCPSGGLNDSARSQDITNLLPNTDYEVKLCSDNQAQGVATLCSNKNGGVDNNNPFNPPGPLTTFTTLATPPPPPPPPPGSGPDLTGMHKIWEDTASSQTPVENGLWQTYAMARRDGGDSSSTSFSQVVPSTFVQHPTGGPGGAFGPSYYTFYGDPNGYSTPGSRGRSELQQPLTPTPTSYCSNYEGAPANRVYLCPGHRYVTFTSIRVPAGTSLFPSGWRAYFQWKNNQSASCCDQPFPWLGLNLYDGKWGIGSKDGNDFGIWSKPATSADVGVWINWAFVIDFEGNDTGSVRVYGDFNNDGTYEYDSGVRPGQTLSTENGVPVPANPIAGIYESQSGDYVDRGDTFIWG